MKITSKGQVTIPLEIRVKMGFLPHTDIKFIVKDDTVLLVKTESPEMSRSKRLMEIMRGSSTVKMSTDEIMFLTRGDK
ncbi:MAG: AbrB/MazE/SpoVT family DNA-binding domain-containing protein [Proteobacteria bacterium]|nr:AbrB/MazE/SpoVT family DNA-binding domain-containing protein [Pseudomonadota bacterium]